MEISLPFAPVGGTPNFSSEIGMNAEFLLAGEKVFWKSFKMCLTNVVGK
jgi:hypothetical protein